ncbi:MAG: hypothetical protein Ct9H300mP1_34700 [Planctomycetaceae bacterium]|nr:MAG: hypothetical protein Ct9H300mP1_34700 [Planctomycetaceae bacterium]
MTLPTVLVVVEDLAEIDELGPFLLGSDLADHPVDAEPEPRLPIMASRDRA